MAVKNNKPKAKKKTANKKTTITPQVLPVSVETLLTHDIFEYAQAVMLRANPNVLDCMKTSERRVYQILLRYKSYTKSVRIVGDVMGELNPHGDSSIYGTLCKLSHTNLPIVTMHGNIGDIYYSEDAPAAMRYTEAKLSKIGELIIDHDIKDIVPTMPNFDDRTTEYVSMPIKLPLGIINGSKGIGYGYATDIPGHNPVEVIDAMIKILSTVRNDSVDIRIIMDAIKSTDIKDIHRNTAKKIITLLGKKTIINAFNKVLENDGTLINVSTICKGINKVKVKDIINIDMLSKAIGKLKSEPNKDTILRALSSIHFDSIGVSDIITGPVRRGFSEKYTNKRPRLMNTLSNSINSKTVYKIEDGLRGTKKVIISKIPIGGDITRMIDGIKSEISKQKFAKNDFITIRNIEDQTSKLGVRLILTFRKDTTNANIKLQLKKLKLLEKRVSYSNTFLVPHKSAPIKLSITEALSMFIDHRIKYKRIGLEDRVRKIDNRIVILDIRKVLANDRELFTNIFVKSKTKENAVNKLIKYFKCSEDIAINVLSTKYDSAINGSKKIKEEITKLKLERTRLKKGLKDINKYLIDELTELRVVVKSEYNELKKVR